MKVGCAVMEWLAVLCLLSGEWWPGALCVRLTGQLMSESISPLQPSVCSWKDKGNLDSHL